MGFFSVFKKKASPASVRPAAGLESPVPSTAGPKPVAAPTATAAQSPTPAARQEVPLMLRQLVTEKATNRVAAGQYTFLVDTIANKIMVRQAVVERFGVKPRKITIVNMPSRKVRFGRVWGRRKGYKKAIVSLPPGTKIEPEKSSS